MGMLTRSFLLGGAVILSVAAASLAQAPLAHAANIITFGNNATSCGGAVLCSYNGTLGYRGTQPFDLSTMASWFQIDVTGTSLLPGQPAEPNGGAGSFLVTNDTGHIVTSYSLNMTDTFTSSSPSVTCSGGVCQDNFQIAIGAANYFTNATLTGVDCISGCGTHSADFMPDLVTYNWSGGSGVPVGATFLITFSSLNNSVDPVPVPIAGAGLPGILFAGGGLLAWWRKKRKGTAAVAAA